MKTTCRAEPANSTDLDAARLALHCLPSSLKFEYYIAWTKVFEILKT